MFQSIVKSSINFFYFIYCIFFLVKLEKNTEILVDESNGRNMEMNLDISMSPESPKQYKGILF